MNCREAHNGKSLADGSDYTADPQPGPLTRLAFEAVAHVSPRLAYVDPLRSALLNRLCKQIHTGGCSLRPYRRRLAFATIE